MLILQKIRKKSAKKVAAVLFVAGMVTGAGVPLATGAGAGNASAAANTVATGAHAVSQVNEGAAVTYQYGRITVSDAYPLYITAAFATAGGLFIYALTYVPVRVKARVRSQYASRVATWAKTTY